MHGKSNYGGNDQINAKKRHFQFILAQRWVSVIDSVPTLIQNKAKQNKTARMYAQQQHITTQYTDPVAVQYRARVLDKGPTLKRDRASTVCPLVGTQA